jgi:sugar/nucleoside kinase (ribokinase family)
MKKFDIVTFGSAAWDAFVGLGRTETVVSEKFINKGICFNLGSKIDVDNLSFASGGAGTNTATTFVNQGFETAYVGVVGDDIYGAEIVRELKQRGVSVKFVRKTNIRPTNYSIVFRSEQDRTIFAYRGASELFETKDIPKVNADWFYVATLSGKSAECTKNIVDYAVKNNIKVALNPGSSQLILPELPEILKKIDVLILNQEEASILTKISFTNESGIFKKIDDMCPGITIMTKGADGVVVSDGSMLYKAGSPDVKVIERTGAGDAFGSGFVSGLMLSKGDVESAIQLGLANSVSCIQKIGAKNGLIKKNAKFDKVEIKKEGCCPDCDCKLKI